MRKLTKKVIVSALLVLAGTVLPLFAQSSSGVVSIEILKRDDISPGEVVILEIVTLPDVLAITGNCFDREIFFWKADSSRFRGLIGLDRDAPSGSHLVHLTLESIDGRSTEVIEELVVEDRKFGLITLRIPRRAQAFTKEEIERIQHEKAETDSILSFSHPERLWTSSFEPPLDRLTITGDFGLARIINGRKRSSHGGLDLRGKSGTPVAASNDGVVVFCGEHFYSGRSVYIDHGLGVFSMYFHLSSILVKSGEKVSKDQVIGKVGSTGRSTAPHLHWAFIVNRARIDPISMISLPVE